MELIWIGPTKPESFQKVLSMYQARVLKYSDLKITTLKNIKGIDEGYKLIAEEEKLFMKSLGTKKRFIILLDEKGKQFSSRAFASWIESKRSNVRSELTFIFGGAFGFSEEFKIKADEIISFSPMTFSHQLIRLVFLEQLYRAFTIINNQPYHND